MDKGNGQLLQSYRGHTNKNYRIRSCLSMADSVVISGSEDGKLYAWDLLEGQILEKLEAHGGKVASAVTCNGVKKEWASAGVDGECPPILECSKCRLRLQQVPSAFGPCQSDVTALRTECLGEATADYLRLTPAILVECSLNGRHIRQRRKRCCCFDSSKYAFGSLCMLFYKPLGSATPSTLSRPSASYPFLLLNAQFKAS